MLYLHPAFNDAVHYRTPKNQTITIRQARLNEKELRQIARMHARSWKIYFETNLLPKHSEPFFDKETFYQERLKDLRAVQKEPHKYFTLVAEIDGRIIGVCNGGHMSATYLDCVHPSMKDKGLNPQSRKIGCSNEIYIDPDYQRTHVGYMLMHEKARILKNMKFEQVITFAQSGHSSPKFFEKMGAFFIGQFNAELNDMLENIKGIKPEGYPPFNMSFDVFCYKSIDEILRTTKVQLKKRSIQLAPQ